MPALGGKPQKVRAGQMAAMWQRSGSPALSSASRDPQEMIQYFLEGVLFVPERRRGRVAQGWGHVLARTLEGERLVVRHLRPDSFIPTHTHTHTSFHRHSAN